ncbi:MAG: MlaD family protein [Gammaproteobacteria bacterium]|nr:MlaD family protein [Gammaproteobacteria bacterium]
MTDSQHDMPDNGFADVEVSRKSGISIFWVIPLIALLIGGWLSITAYLDKGPLVTIIFKQASGVIANKTKVRMHDVDIGVVESVTLSEDFTQAVVKARLSKESEKLLVEGTKFWVEEPRVSATEIRGLQTLLSGVFIGIKPASSGKSTTDFVGLEEPPFIPDEQGRYFTLSAKQRGSLNKGSPVIYRGLDVGQVVSYKMRDDGDIIDVKVFIKAPFFNYVNMNTRFWESSGIEVSLSAEGFELQTESMTTILIGGISYGLPPFLPKAEITPDNHKFILYPDKNEAFTQTYDSREMVMYFNGSVRGLEIGAPVEFRGMKVGEVTDIRLQFDAQDFAIQIPVFVEIYYGRMEIVGRMDVEALLSEQGSGEHNMQRLVDNGMRARLESGSLLTGARLVALDMYPDEPRVDVVMENDRLVVPTLPTSLDELTAGLTSIINKISAMPLEQIGRDLGGAVNRTRQLLESNEIEDAIMSLDATLQETAAFTRSMNTTITPQIDATLRELKNASRSIKAMADYLERHPEALIKGKGK